MALQLVLRLDPPADDWRLDEHTCEVGRQGVAEARRALAQARPPTTAGDAPADQHRPAAA